MNPENSNFSNNRLDSKHKGLDSEHKSVYVGGESAPELKTQDLQGSIGDMLDKLKGSEDILKGETNLREEYSKTLTILNNAERLLGKVDAGISMSSDSQKKLSSGLSQELGEKGVDKGTIGKVIATPESIMENNDEELRQEIISLNKNIKECIAELRKADGGLAEEDALEKEKTISAIESALVHTEIILNKVKIRLQGKIFNGETKDV